MTHSPLIRISLGLVLVTCSILLGLDLAGFAPHEGNRVLESRVRVVERLAAQAAAAAERNDLAAIRSVFMVSVRREEELLSAGLRSPRGRLLVAVGDHRMLWDPDPETRSRSSHASVPVFKGGKPWGAIEVRFADLGSKSVFEALWDRPMVRLILLLGFTGFFGYMFYLKRTLRYLDPSAVIPARVQAALDVMAEGVILLDRDERIVLANVTFSEWIGKTPSALMGVKASTLGWSDPYAEDHVPRYPWRQAIESAEAFTGVRLFLSTEEGDGRAILVNGAPILDGWGRAKGAIATFDDVTELERNKAELEHVLAELQKSQEEIRLQNEELQLLATRDPLTGVANRRSFLEGFAQEFERAKLEGRKLCCLMVDIDHFKRINDTHGHATGDEVIRRVSDALGGAVRSSDGVCRYGGEEFCIALPAAPIEEALQVAERIRAQIDSPGFARVPVTASFGVTAIEFGATTPEHLINQADEALYSSKESGRNRVTRWDQRAGTEG